MLILTGFALSSVVFSAHAETKKPEFEMSADRMERVSKTITQLNGNAVIRLGRSEIKTDKARIVFNKHKVTVYTDTLIATGKR
jgi:lipopolysaccharide export system protein LptA